MDNYFIFFEMLPSKTCENTHKDEALAKSATPTMFT